MRAWHPCDASWLNSNSSARVNSRDWAHSLARRLRPDQIVASLLPSIPHVSRSTILTNISAVPSSSAPPSTAAAPLHILLLRAARAHGRLRQRRLDRRYPTRAP